MYIHTHVYMFTETAVFMCIAYVCVCVYMYIRIYAQFQLCSRSVSDETHSFSVALARLPPMDFEQFPDHPSPKPLTQKMLYINVVL